MKKVMNLTPDMKGKKIRCSIGENVIEDAKIQCEEGIFYICQNTRSGNNCSDKLGYIYSWGCGDGSVATLKISNVTDITLKKKKSGMVMCDSEMVEEVLSISDLVLRADKNWRLEVERAKLRIIGFPFEGCSYNAKLEFYKNYGVYVFVEALTTTLSINRFCYGNDRFVINDPFVSPEMKFYGVYNATGEWSAFATTPRLGAHYMVNTEIYSYLCLGGYSFEKPKTLADLVSRCNEVAKLMEMINYNSLATIFLPSEGKNGAFVDGLKGKLFNKPETLERFIDNGVLTLIKNEL